MVNDEYNRHTIGLKFHPNDLPPSFKNDEEPSIKDINNRIGNLFGTVDSLEKLKVKNDVATQKFAKENLFLNDELWKSHTVNLEKTIRKNTSEIRIKMDRLNTEINGLKLQSSINPEDKYAVTAANLNLKLAVLRLEEAKIIAEAHNKSFKTYFDKDLYQKNILAADSGHVFYLKNSTILEAIQKKKGEILDATIDFHFHRNQRLNLLDFLYFSAGAATSSNFGDIVPNSTWVRLLVFCQIVSSIIVFGLLVNAAIKELEP
ncbi:potassium channel family protein [Pedobacter sp. MC2016-24]|uniref:potassium channel family protein n=1 Tax=Pedobacter sp. MC2016-24 TaxID=2780090 RepID=UPI001882F1AA|nr:potassium channel family protein [Pedobacter sp. MC2016-24]MBE9599991.1 two pore domain potassium channel family protein [Pedobacter sp. MC2016-24]